MKRQLLIILVALLVTVSTYGQARIKPAIGLTVSNVTQDPATGESQAQVGYQLGASFPIGSIFYVEPGLFFVKKSIGFTSSSASSEDIDLNMHGLRIPLVLGHHLIGTNDSFFALRIFGGGSSFILSGVKTEGADKDDFKSPSWGMFVGTGANISFLFVDIKYEWSVTDASDLENFDVGKTKSFFANAGIRLEL
ncbi:hypothetical protein GCM10028791_37440 [Echinicola sediminis]